MNQINLFFARPAFCTLEWFVGHGAQALLKVLPQKSVAAPVGVVARQKRLQFPLCQDALLTQPGQARRPRLTPRIHAVKVR